MLGTSGPISMKFGMKFCGIKFIIVHSNGDPELTLTYIMTTSNCVTCFLYGKFDSDGFLVIYCNLNVVCVSDLRPCL